MIETAEDHYSNSMKIALTELKRNGGKFIAIIPIRIGYAGIADKWKPIKPSANSALFLSIINEIIKQDSFDRDFLINNTNCAELVNMDKASSQHGMLLSSALATDLFALFAVAFAVQYVGSFLHRRITRRTSTTKQSSYSNITVRFS